MALLLQNADQSHWNFRRARVPRSVGPPSQLQGEYRVLRLLFRSSALISSTDIYFVKEMIIHDVVLLCHGYKIIVLRWLQPRNKKYCNSESTKLGRPHMNQMKNTHCNKDSREQITMLASSRNNNRSWDWLSSTNSSSFRKSLSTKVGGQSKLAPTGKT